MRGELSVHKRQVERSAIELGPPSLEAEACLNCA